MQKVILKPLIVVVFIVVFICFYLFTNNNGTIEGSFRQGNGTERKAFYFFKGIDFRGGSDVLLEYEISSDEGTIELDLKGYDGEQILHMEGSGSEVLHVERGKEYYLYIESDDVTNGKYKIKWAKR